MVISQNISNDPSGRQEIVIPGSSSNFSQMNIYILNPLGERNSLAHFHNFVFGNVRNENVVNENEENDVARRNERNNVNGVPVNNEEQPEEINENIGNDNNLNMEVESDDNGINENRDNENAENVGLVSSVAMEGEIRENENNENKVNELNKGDVRTRLVTFYDLLDYHL